MLVRIIHLYENRARLAVPHLLGVVVMALLPKIGLGNGRWLVAAC